MLYLFIFTFYCVLSLLIIVDCGNLWWNKIRISLTEIYYTKGWLLFLKIYLKTTIAGEPKSDVHIKMVIYMIVLERRLLTPTIFCELSLQLKIRVLNFLNLISTEQGMMRRRKQPNKSYKFHLWLGLNLVYRNAGVLIY